MREIATSQIALTDALAPVALTDSPNVAIDWSSGVFFTLTQAGNRTWSNPTNVVPGSTRVVYVVGNSGVSRTVSFGTSYKGDLPTITDMTSSKGYLVTLFAVSPTHIVPISVRAL